MLIVFGNIFLYILRLYKLILFLNSIELLNLKFSFQSNKLHYKFYLHKINQFYYLLF